MKLTFLLAGLALCLFSLWALARHDWLRLTRPPRRVLATVVGYRGSMDEGHRNFAARFRFSAEGAEHEVVDAVYGSTRAFAEGTVMELVYPEGRPDLARPPRLVLWAGVYGVFVFLTTVLGTKLLGLL
ncbi:hypothetical protein [Novosphingobium sp. Chol11]|uniref:hypothetical protein n=1 Tax=Novosphingobium sp. Chol11 TaxID=1385763 RepID=UPI0025EAE195|nr:hypothetical protein [Novosphingobium sp. Chol11]